MAVVERIKQESIYGLSAKRVVVVERWPLVEVRLKVRKQTKEGRLLSTLFPTNDDLFDVSK